MRVPGKFLMGLLSILCIAFTVNAQDSKNTRDEKAVPVEVQAVQVQELYRSVFYGCRLQPAERYVHRSPISGTLESIPVRTGQRVSQGTLLFTVRRDLAGRSYNSVEVRAVHAGIVSENKLTPGEPVQENEALIEVLDDSAFTAGILVSDKDIGTIRQGDSCVIYENKIPTRATGKVTMLAPEPEYETGLFPVELRVLKAPGLFIGKFIRIELKMEPYTGIAVPSVHIVRKYSEDHLYIVKDGTAELRPVTLGQAYNDLVTVTAGVAEGELYVTSNTRRLSSGTAVTITEGQ